MKPISIDRLERSETFKHAYKRLSDAQKKEVFESLDQLLQDPDTSWLRLHELEGFPGIYSISADGNLRVTFRVSGSVAILQYTGTHDIYENY